MALALFPLARVQKTHPLHIHRQAESLPSTPARGHLHLPQMLLSRPWRHNPVNEPSARGSMKLEMNREATTRLPAWLTALK